jgi:hypothetical protein
MSKKMRVVVDLPEDLYKQIKELAGGADNVSSFVYKEMRDNMRARAASHFQQNSISIEKECPPNCRTVTNRVGDNLCSKCRLLTGR